MPDFFYVVFRACRALRLPALVDDEGDAVLDDCGCFLGAALSVEVGVSLLLDDRDDAAVIAVNLLDPAQEDIEAVDV